MKPKNNNVTNPFPDRYSRQINLPQLGDSGQEKLEQAKVLVVGAGGLGCAVLPYLVSAGIGTIGIVDGDTVEGSNLHRQVLYGEEAVGKQKAVEARNQLQRLNSTVAIQAYPFFLDASNTRELFHDYDLILDATDTIGVRYLINDACVLTGKPFVYGSVYRFEGQVSVFNYRNGPTYRCLFPRQEGIVQNCAEVGVLGTTVGLVGMLQASEVMKIILGTGEVLAGKLLMYDTLTGNQEVFNFEKNESLQIDSDFFERTHMTASVQYISAEKALAQDSILLDVREPEEVPQLHHDGLLSIPLSVLEQELTQLDRNQTYATFCQSGKRSLQAAEILTQNGFKNVFSIQEGAAAIAALVPATSGQNIKA